MSTRQAIKILNEYISTTTRNNRLFTDKIANLQAEITELRARLQRLGDGRLEESIKYIETRCENEELKGQIRQTTPNPDMAKMTCEIFAGEKELLKAENATKDIRIKKLEKLLHYLSGMQDFYDSEHKYPTEHHEWAVGQENGSITGDFDKWLIKQTLKDGE